MVFKEYKTVSGEIILYTGDLNTQRLEDLANGYGDIWHSSFEQGYKNAFLDIAIQGSVLFWYVIDFDDLDECVSWRINPNHFAVRKTVWELLGGFDDDFDGIQMKALDFGFNALRFQGVVPLYVKGLFETETKESVEISTRDRYIFFIKNFKIDHALFMIYRKGLFNLSEWSAYRFASNNFQQRKESSIVSPRKLKPIEGNPTVSYIIPTMMRQDFTCQLLEDLQNQTYKPTQVVIVDATPENQRDEKLYDQSKFDFELIIKWQTTKGSCRARNEAIDLCTSDYIIFGDDDIRIPSDYVANHISFLQTYNADACNGLDIRADHQKQNLEDLKFKLENYGEKRFLCGVAPHINNANNCVKREFVNLINGNDINFDGGYGEDNDFGLSLTKAGVVVLQNAFSTNLHLKPPVGGYRFWGSQSKILGKKRKTQPWELDTPVKWIRPVPSPTMMYYFYKHFGDELTNEYKHKYFFLQLFKGSFSKKITILIKLPYKLLQFNKSLFYAKKLNSLGKRNK